MGWREQEVVSLLRLSLIPFKRYTLHYTPQKIKFKIQRSNWNCRSIRVNKQREQPKKGYVIPMGTCPLPNNLHLARFVKSSRFFFYLFFLFCTFDYFDYLFNNKRNVFDVRSLELKVGEDFIVALSLLCSELLLHRFPPFAFFNF